MYSEGNGSVLRFEDANPQIKKKQKDYIKLLNEKIALEKECDFIDFRYIKTFGTFMLKLLKLQAKCEKCSLILRILKRCNDEKREFNKDAAMQEIANELKPMYAQIDRVRNKKNEDLKLPTNTEEKDASRILRKIVGLIHPDINKKAYRNDQVKKLWDKSIEYYNETDSRKLNEVYLEAKNILKELKVKQNEILNEEELDLEIEFVKEEIFLLHNLGPYPFKNVLQNENEVINHKSFLLSEIEETEEVLEDFTNDLLELGIDIDEFDIV